MTSSTHHDALTRHRRRIESLLVAACLALSAPTARADAIGEALRQRAEALRASCQSPVAARSCDTRLAEFYEDRNFAPAWATGERREALLAAVDDSVGHGLDPARYHRDDLREASLAVADDPAVLASRDLLFSRMLARLADDLRYGSIDPHALHPAWKFPDESPARHPAEAIAALASAPDLRVALERLAPQTVLYSGLREALSLYRRIAAEGGWPRVPSGPTLREGMQDARLNLLRARLTATGDLDALAGVTSPDQFDAGLAAAVNRFQARHMLAADAAVGRRTLAALNVAVEQRIAQIRINLERLRWIAHDLVGDYLLVDTAGFEAHLFLGGSLAWTSRVVVGRRYRETPEFRARLQYLVLNPAWVVPPTILRQDVLPKLAADPDYLVRHEMQVFDSSGRPVAASGIAWSRYRERDIPYRIVQAPGPDNPLGRIKFGLPNPYAVYLHDTPSRNLFERIERTFSSGCIRLEHPLELAVALLDEPDTWTEQKLRAAIGTGRTVTIPVRRPVPVLLLYFTAKATADGSVQFRADPYGRDASILAALERASTPD